MTAKPERTSPRAGSLRAAAAPTVPFGSRVIGPGAPVVVIAEIGINHEGDAGTCARMIEAAAAAGADAIKLQTIDADENYVRDTESYEVFHKSGLSREGTAEMFEFARRNGVEPFTTAGDPATLEWVDRLAPAAHKISSGLLTNGPLIRQAAVTGRTLLMSTGMAEVEDVDAAVAAAVRHPVGLFQCTSLYPAPSEALNLATIGWLERRYGVPAGFSDHSVGSVAAELAVAAGARMIEKHFTLDTRRAGYDHSLSLDPSAFADMTRRVRRAEVMMGNAAKRPVPDERAIAARYRRVLVARRDIAAGAVFDTGNVSLKRPRPGGRGLAPAHYDSVLGKRALRRLRADDTITAEVVEGGP